MHRPLDPVKHITQYLDPKFSLHISPAKDFVFIESPKVGCSSLKHVLFKMLSPGGAMPDDIHNRSYMPTLSYDGITKDELEAMLFDPAVFRFAFVRDPVDRLISLYYSAIIRKAPLKYEILKQLGRNEGDELDIDSFFFATCDRFYYEMDYHCKPQHLQILSGLVEMSFIGRFENFERDTRRAFSKIHNQAIELPHINMGHQRLVAPSQRAREAVWAKYETDYRTFNYPFE